jgi:hypothetical protein
LTTAQIRIECDPITRANVRGDTRGDCFDDSTDFVTKYYWICLQSEEAAKPVEVSTAETYIGNAQQHLAVFQ